MLLLVLMFVMGISDQACEKKCLDNSLSYPGFMDCVERCPAQTKAPRSLASLLADSVEREQSDSKLLALFEMLNDKYDNCKRHCSRSTNTTPEFNACMSTCPH